MRREGAAAFLGLLWTAAAAAQGVPSAAPVRPVAARLEAGDSAWARGDHAAAFVEYETVVRADSAASTRALFRLGTLHAWANRLPQAIACHALYVRLEPADLDGRVALGRTYSWASRFPQSLAQYDTAISRAPDHRDAVLGRATTLAWWGRLSDAIGALAQWQGTHSTDGDAALMRARFLSWAGQLNEALALYDSLSTLGDAVEAERGRARVLAWRGDLIGAEAGWRAIIARLHEDSEAWVGLGQVLRWQGRTFAARSALERALALAPTSNDAREQLRWVEAEISPASAMVLVHAEDSERNRSTSLEVSGTSVPTGNVRLTGSARWKSVALGAADALIVPAAMGTAQWQPSGGSWTLRLDAGVVRFPAGTAPMTTVWQGGVRASGRLGARVTVGGGASRAPFDDIVSAASRRLSLAIIDADVGVTLRPRLSVGLAVSRGTARGDLLANDRSTVFAAVRWSPQRSVQTAISHREFGWDRAAPGVYFAPERFAITEGSVRWEWPRDLGLVAAAEVGLGSQSVRFALGAPTSRLAPRGAMRLGWRPLPGREIVAGVQLANVAAVGTVAASEYRYGAATLTARWVF